MSFVAELDGRLTGAALSGHDGRRGYIHHLAVHPDYRRQGIGEELIKHCLAALAADGIQKCHLYVFTKNQGGICFWEDTGWTRRDDLLMMSQYT
jgi:ribosomal protein S18 acetylase RimI-like enzyme